MSQDTINPSYLDRAIADPDRGFSSWGIWEIWTGPTGAGNYVPNVDDMVIDWDHGIYRVVGVDYTTGLSDLRPWSWKPTEETSDEDVLLASGPGAASEAWRVYLDTRKFPYTLSPDAALHIYGEEAAYYKLFRGSNVTPSGQVLSALYDQNNDFITDSIPMQLVRTPTPGNLAIKAPKSCYTNQRLDDGDTMTMVVYGTGGNVVYKRKLVVENTSLTRRGDDAMRYVQSISLKSAWLSPSDANLVEFPINVDIRTVVLTGVVEYTNGERLEYPITLDGSSRFSLFGLDNYIPTIEGQTVPLVLNYVLQENEYSTIMAVTESGSVTQPYRARTMPVDKAYSVKLFAYPKWVDPIVGYDLEFWLFNLDRREYHRVPRSLVEIADGSRNFDGLDFLSNQRIAFAVNLADVDPRYVNYRHVQTMDVSLRAAGNLRGTNWLVNYEPGVVDPYGAEIEAAVTFVNTNQWYVNLKNGAGSYEAWLNKLYYPVRPLRDTRSEATPPVPTHFAIHTKRRRVEFESIQWEADLPIINDLAEGETLYIEWFKRTSTTDLRLGVTGLPVHVVNQ